MNLKFSEQTISVLAVDVGGTAIKFGYWNQQHLSHIKTIETPKTWVKMKQAIKDELDSIGLVDGLAVSLPGSVDVDEGIVRGISAVSYIHNFHIRQELSDYLEIPVSIQNDANCAALAEIWMGNLCDVKEALCVVIGSGVGGAQISNGELQQGFNLFGGEFGYMILQKQNFKSFSELVSPVQLAYEYCKIQSVEGVDGKVLFELAQKGDATALMLVNQFYDYLAIGVFNLLVAFNPQRILIGGAISRRAELASTLTKKVEKLIDAKQANGLYVDIQNCLFYNESNLVGAVYQFLKDN